MNHQTTPKPGARDGMPSAGRVSPRTPSFAPSPGPEGMGLFRRPSESANSSQEAAPCRGAPEGKAAPREHPFRSDIGIAIVCGVLLLGLPLLGVFLAGKPLRDYAQFPPLTRYVEHEPFSWPVFVAMALLIFLVILPFDFRAVTRRAGPRPRHRRPFPWWGWTGIGISCVMWILAWNRFRWFAPLQLFAFSPLWIGYILTVNACCCARTGRSMLTHSTRHFLCLFPVSAAFWWFFEYLNRFVQNWYYEGGDHLSPFQYFLFATLPFSTVLPAVLGTYDLLESFPRAGAGLDDFIKISLPRRRLLAGLALAASSFALLGIGIRPSYLFPVLWLSPLFIITSIQAVLGESTIFSPIAAGRWRRLYLLAMAALVCGFFWEMWNYGSFAKWIYQVPFVGRFKIFEMPMLGFAGYLPFGLECAVLADLALGRRRRENDGSHSAA